MEIYPLSIFQALLYLILMVAIVLPLKIVWFKTSERSEKIKKFFLKIQEY